MTGEPNVDRRILVVEDEPDLRELLTYNLTAAGFTVQATENGTDGLEAVQRFAPDVVLLDLMLPDIPGTEVCRRIRGDTAAAPAGRDDADRQGRGDRPRGRLRAGRRRLRRQAIQRARAGAARGRHPSRAPPGPRQPTQAAPQRRRYIVGPLELDVDGYHVFVNGAEVHVSTLEMRLLAYLVEHRGRVRSREDLLEDVWGYKPGVSTRTIDTHVKRLRDKLGDAGALVETVRGTGYRLSADHQVVIKD